MAEPRLPFGALRKDVAKFGNSGHVTVPRSMVGEEVYLVPREELVYLSTAFPNPHLPAVIGSDASFSAHAMNAHGEEMVLLASRKDGRPILYHEDLDWQPLDLMHASGDLVAVRRDQREDVTLSLEEKGWMMSCLQLWGIGISDLPAWKQGETLSQLLGRALVSGDRSKQIAVLEKVLAELKKQN